MVIYMKGEIQDSGCETESFKSLPVNEEKQNVNGYNHCSAKLPELTLRSRNVSPDATLS